MTPTKKVLLAVAFVAAGYGIASQLGAPQLQLMRRPQPLADANAAIRSAPDARPAQPVSPSHVGARLVPDVQPPAVSPAVDSHLEDVNDQFPIRSQSEFELVSVSAPPLGPSVATSPSSKTDFAPRARLRSEAPRPLDIERRAPVRINAVPQASATGHDVAHASAHADEAANSAPFDGLREQHTPIRVESDQSRPPADAVSAIAAPGDYDNSYPAAHHADRIQSRSHIIVDGDSLAKLAARYLDDPQRASEIYELNRDVLSHPDVLPIGAKLVIPSPSVSLNSVGESSQSLIPHGAAVHAASRGGLVPVRPIPHEAIVMPRAQLIRPRAAE